MQPLQDPVRAHAPIKGNNKTQHGFPGRARMTQIMSFNFANNPICASEEHTG
jgi:hypothetical protein